MQSYFCVHSIINYYIHVYFFKNSVFWWLNKKMIIHIARNMLYNAIVDRSILLRKIVEAAPVLKGQAEYDTYVLHIWIVVYTAYVRCVNYEINYH